MRLRVRIAFWLLKTLSYGELSVRERSTFTSLILSKLDVAPLGAIIKVDETGQLLLRGKPADLEMIKVLQTHASIAFDNKAESLIDEQLIWETTVYGIHNGDDPVKLLFYRAAIWWYQQRKRYLSLLAGRQEPEPLSPGSYS